MFSINHRIIQARWSWLLFALLSTQLSVAQTAFTSSPTLGGTYNVNYTYGIVTSGSNPRAITLSSGALPNGVILTDQGDGTAVLSGIVLQTGSFPIELQVTELTPNTGMDTQDFTITISKATATISLSNLSSTYDGTPQEAMVATTPLGLTVDITYNGLSTPPTNAGSYAISALINDQNYQGTSSGTLTVSQAPLTAKADNQPRLYGQSNPTLSITYTGFVNGDNASSITAPTAATTATATSNVGSYTITLTGGTATNYSLTLQSGTLTIGQAPLTAKADNQSRMYGQLNPTLSITYTGFVNSDNSSSITVPTASTTATATSNVGSYTITLTGGVATNYSLTLQSGSLTVSQAPLTAKADNQSRMYGQLNPTLSITYTGFVNGDLASSITVPTASTTATATSNVGSYTITLTGGVATNYSLTLQSGSLTVSQAPLTAKADNQSRMYGQLNPTLSITYTGFVNGDLASSITVPTASTTATATSNVGSYTITLTGGTATNYSLTLQNGSLIVSQAPLTAKADNQSRMYGQLNPTLSITYTGFVNSDNSSSITVPTASTTATATSNVGSYTITLTGGVATNYTLTLQSGSLTVSQAPLTAKADNQSRMYGQLNPTLSITYTGFVNSDNSSSITVPTASTTATATSDVGSYTITVSGGTATNYSLTLQNGTLTIGQAPLTAKADNQSRMYGQPNPTLSITYTGFVNGDLASSITVPTASTTATAASNVGSYIITLTGGTATNYSLTLQNGSLIVSQAPLTAKADNQSRMYGQLNPTLSITYTGFVNGDNVSSITVPTAATTATATSNVGGYTITVSGGTATNYSLTLQNGSLTVGKAPLTATADNQSRMYGQPNPTLSITYTGFVNGDLASSITVPTASTTATATSNVGAYTITVSGGTATNYSLTLQNGTLTIGQAPLTAKADNQSRLYGQSNPTLSITYTGFVNGDNASSITAPTAATTATVTSNVGSYTITTSGGVATNYSFVYQNGILTISKATPTLTWSNPSSITFGTPLSAIQLNATADVAGTFSYAPGIGTILIAGANQALSVNFIPTDGANYNPVNGTQVQITVAKATPTIVWAKPNPIKLGVALSSVQLNATAIFNSALVPGVFTYFPPAGTVLAVGNNQILSVDFVPTDISNYTSVLHTQQLITVNLKDVPIVTWSNPSPITYATSLTAGQLNASANVPGSFVYSPPLGFIMNSGANQMLSAIFRPIDGTTYDTITTTILLTVNKAILTATPQNTSKVYGQSNPANTIKYTGFVNGDNVASITPPSIDNTSSGAAATVLTGAGVYPITLKGGAASNYTFNLQPGSLTITKALLTATADNKSKVYGAPNPQLTTTYQGFLNSDGISALSILATASTTATPSSQVSSYPIIPSGAVASNYDFKYVSGALSVNKAILTVTADDQGRLYGAVDPTFTINYSGFVNSDNLTALNTFPTATTVATATSNVGNYPIVVSGGNSSNYTFNYVSGSLQIKKVNLTATADNKSRLYGAPNPILTISYSGFVNGENESVLNTPPVATTTAISSSGIGNYPIIVSDGMNNNYDFNYVSGNLKITVNAPPTIKDFTITTDENSPFSFNYSMFNKNFVGDPGDKIISVKITTTPSHGILYWLGNAVSPGAMVKVTNGVIDDLKYFPGVNYYGSDSFGWNVFDSVYFATSDAEVLINITHVNAPPTLNNTAVDTLTYRPGDPAILVTNQLTLNDIDNGSMVSATVSITDNRESGDLLALDVSVSKLITSSFDGSTGKLTLKGKDSNSNYQSALNSILFSSPVSSNNQLLVKRIDFIVNDSVSNSNVVSREIKITDVFPELSLVNAFTPNNDGINDFWDFGNLNYYDIVKIEIFDKVGNKVFDCSSNDCKWDGKTGSKDLPSGPYQYLIDLENGKRKYSGIVTILK